MAGCGITAGAAGDAANDSPGTADGDIVVSDEKVSHRMALDEAASDEADIDLAAVPSRITGPAVTGPVTTADISASRDSVAEREDLAVTASPEAAGSPSMECVNAVRWNQWLADAAGCEAWLDSGLVRPTLASTPSSRQPTPIKMES
jgi:hypothetical protein